MKKKELSSTLKAGTAGALTARTETPAMGKKGGRDGLTLIGGYFDPAVKTSLRMIQVKHVRKTFQDLLAEALNDLFQKHNVPQTAQVQKKGGHD